MADDVGAGSAKREGTWVVRDDAADQRAQLAYRSVFEFHVTDEGYGHHRFPLAVVRAPENLPISPADGQVKPSIVPSPIVLPRGSG